MKSLGGGNCNLSCFGRSDAEIRGGLPEPEASSAAGASLRGWVPGQAGVRVPRAVGRALGSS